VLDGVAGSLQSYPNAGRAAWLLQRSPTLAQTAAHFNDHLAEKNLGAAAWDALRATIAELNAIAKNERGRTIAH